MKRWLAWIGLAIIGLGGLVQAAEVVGWRGNWTGLWPEAEVPVEWRRVAVGPTHGLRQAMDRTGGDGAPADAMPVDGGLITQWLLLGPIAVEDAISQFDEAQIADEANIAPSAGQKVGDLAWTPLALEPPGKWEFGTTDLRWLRIDKAFEANSNQVAYVHSYLYAERAGSCARWRSTFMG